MTIAEVAYHLAQQVFPRYAHAKSPHTYTLPQLVAGVWRMVSARKSDRDREEWLLASEAVCQALGLPEVPDPTTLYRAYRRLTRHQLARLFQTLLDPLGVQEMTIALDTTGFRPTQASLHYLARSGRGIPSFSKGPMRWAPTAS